MCYMEFANTGVNESQWKPCVITQLLSFEVLKEATEPVVRYCSCKEFWLEMD